LSAWQLSEPKNRAKLAHYRDSLEMLDRVDGRKPLVDRLDAELDRLAAGAGSETPTAGPIKRATRPSRGRHRARAI
jgi:hypothetical protein